MTSDFCIHIIIDVPLRWTQSWFSPPPRIDEEVSLQHRTQFCYSHWPRDHIEVRQRCFLEMGENIMRVSAGQRTYVFNIKELVTYFPLSCLLSHSLSFFLDCPPTMNFFLTVSLLFYSIATFCSYSPSDARQRLHTSSLIQTNSYPRERKVSKILTIWFGFYAFIF